MSYNDRFKDAPWYEGCLNEKILFIGQGGIGSNTMLPLTKTIPATYFIIDDDTVEDINVGSQNFKKSQVGVVKVEAVKNNCNETSSATINAVKQLYNNEYLPIMITGLDNMEARKQSFEEWKKHDNREIFIDGRLRASLYEIYVVRKGDEAKYEATLFEDDEIDDGPCTFKQTAYFGMLIGARITHVLVNYLTNKYTGDEVCNLPFSIKEYGEPFLIETE